jgi:hypothetical protein
VDLAVAFDEEKKLKLQKQIRRNKVEEEAVIKSREGYSGNRYDVDTEIHEGEDD